MSSEPKTVTLDQHQVAEIRRALIVGLACFGEIEERINHMGLDAISGVEWPEGARPTHPTGASDVTSNFATALGFLE